ncbi:hypothetical protein K402DRAFT_390669 [Aulographum hederae CBS 113979]|uniref:Uncharacterized protein n=1 Tax=Aulographum hederae CBS 113979 TaxID=1176131 RepID=A0A6G1H9G5_9PEZI|nr:hypothetical protein K402DRAFT_390669 [Aulographum hederae CBS 113979]
MRSVLEARARAVIVKRRPHHALFWFPRWFVRFTFGSCGLSSARRQLTSFAWVRSDSSEAVNNDSDRETRTIQSGS